MGLVELRINLQVERIIVIVDVEGSCLILLRFVAAVISCCVGLYFFPRGPSAWPWGNFFCNPLNLSDNAAVYPHFYPQKG
jgi:hypothetical protein